MEESHKFVEPKKNLIGFRIVDSKGELSNYPFEVSDFIPVSSVELIKSSAWGIPGSQKKVNTLQLIVATNSYNRANGHDEQNIIKRMYFNGKELFRLQKSLDTALATQGFAIEEVLGE